MPRVGEEGQHDALLPQQPMLSATAVPRRPTAVPRRPMTGRSTTMRRRCTPCSRWIGGRRSARTVSSRCVPRRRHAAARRRRPPPPTATTPPPRRPLPTAVARCRLLSPLLCCRAAALPQLILKHDDDECDKALTRADIDRQIEASKHIAEVVEVSERVTHYSCHICYARRARYIRHVSRPLRPLQPLFQVHDVLWESHKLLYGCFDRYAALGSEDIFGISFNGFKSFCSDCHIIDDDIETCVASVVDQLFIGLNAAKADGKSCEFNHKLMLNRQVGGESGGSRERWVDGVAGGG